MLLSPCLLLDNGRDWYCSAVTNPGTVSQVIWCQLVFPLSSGKSRLSSSEQNCEKLEVDEKNQQEQKEIIKINGSLFFVLNKLHASFLR